MAQKVGTNQRSEATDSNPVREGVSDSTKAEWRSLVDRILQLSRAGERSRFNGYRSRFPKTTPDKDDELLTG